MPTLNLLVWNSQGGKWPVFWTNYFQPVVATGQDAMGLLVEAGWAPWVTPGDVHKDNVYPRDSSASWFNRAKDATDAFCQGVNAIPHRKGHAFWVPWVKNAGEMNVNSRCSMGAVIAPITRNLGSFGRFKDEDPWLYLRPIFRFGLNRPTAQGGAAELSVFLVHLVSGYPTKAQAQMEALISAIGKLVQQNTGAIVVGDFNINIINYAVPFTLPPRWRLLRTGFATQQSGGELDYALLYDPTNIYGGGAVAVVQQFNTGANTSDHSVMRYTVPLT